MAYHDAITTRDEEPPMFPTTAQQSSGSAQNDKSGTPRRDRFWDQVADKYARKPIDDEQAYQRKLEITREFLTPESVVLEIGCGTGSTALLHAPFVKSILATDVSRRMIEIAEGKAAAQEITNVTFRRAGAEELAVDDGGFDAVLALNLLHLLADPEAAIAKVHRWLKPGGVFVSSTVCLGDRVDIFRLIAPFVPIAGRFGLLPSVLKVLKQKDLEDRLTAAGFEVTRTWRPEGSMAAFIIATKRV